MNLVELAKKLEELKELQNELEASEHFLTQMKDPNAKKMGMKYRELDIILQTEKCESLKEKIKKYEQIDIKYTGPKTGLLEGAV